MKKDWGTPKVYADAVCRAFGDTICLDPCSGPHSIVEADKKLMPPRDDGLQHTWDYARIYTADQKSVPHSSDVRPRYAITSSRYLVCLKCRDTAVRISTMVG